MCYPKVLKLIFTLSITLTISPGFAGEAREVNFNKPPSTIAQWYKPANKRQVWLHTMFRLRREMQAMGEYAAFGVARAPTGCGKVRRF